MNRVAEIDEELAEFSGLMSLLVRFAFEQKKPLSFVEFVVLVHDFGYSTQASSVTSLVYQATLRLVQLGLFRKDPENRSYHLVRAEETH